MKKKDIQDYRGYLPMKWWADDIVQWLGKMIGDKWLEQIYINPSTHKTHTRYRFGDIQEAQVYLKNGEYHHIPLEIWYQISSLDSGALDEKCIEWIEEKRAEWKKSEQPVKQVKSKQKGGILDL